MMIIERVQHQLESIYGIRVDERAQDFLINRIELSHYLKNHPCPTTPKELLLIRESGQGEVELGLFLDRRLITNLSRHNPFESISEKNLSDFCILIEGVSHFVYFLWKASLKHCITQLEMELQAEIDKFLMLFLYLQSDQSQDLSHTIFEALFENFKLLENLPPEAKERYQMASLLASKYCHQIQNKYSKQKKIEQIIGEIRNFYQLTQEEKIRHILN